MGAVKFTWISADIEPDKKDEPIVYLTRNNKIGTFRDFSDWDWYHEKYGITQWVYQKHILPTESGAEETG